MVKSNSRPYVHTVPARSKRVTGCKVNGKSRCCWFVCVVLCRIKSSKIMEDSHHCANKATTAAAAAVAAAAAKQFAQQGYLKFTTPLVGPDESCRQLRHDILRQWNAALELPVDQSFITGRTAGIWRCRPPVRSE